MARVKRGVVAHARHKKVLKQAKGYYGARRKVYRVAQIGFKTCALYAEKDCEVGAEIGVSWKNKKAPVNDFTPGARWFLPGERGSKMASWKCEEDS